MQLEPRLPSGVAARPKDFAWITCAACAKDRRVDLATERLFANRTWVHEAAEVERHALHRDYPRLSVVLPTRFLYAPPADGCVTEEFLATTLRAANLSSLLSEPSRRAALLEYVVDLCAQHGFRCDGLQQTLSDLWNARDGPLFTCDMLCECSCVEPCDWRQLGRHFELRVYRPPLPVTVHWSRAAPAGADSADALLAFSFVGAVHRTATLETPSAAFGYAAPV